MWNCYGHPATLAKLVYFAGS